MPQSSRIETVRRAAGLLAGRAVIRGARFAADLPSNARLGTIWAREAPIAARDRWRALRRVWDETRMTDGGFGHPGSGGTVASGQVGALVREGRGVRLRTQVPANRPAFQRWYADPEIARLLRHDQEPLTEIQSRGYFNTIILPLSARGLCFAIHESESDDVVGMTALTDLQSGPGSALFRIVIGEKALWGRGYGTEATRLVVREAFERLGLREVRLEVFRHNPRAIGAYARVGFEQTGEHAEWVPRHGLRLEVVEMRLRRDDPGTSSADHALDHRIETSDATPSDASPT